MMYGWSGRRRVIVGWDVAGIFVYISKGLFVWPALGRFDEGSLEVASRCCVVCKAWCWARSSCVTQEEALLYTAVCYKQEEKWFQR